MPITTAAWDTRPTALRPRSWTGTSTSARRRGGHTILAITRSTGSRILAAGSRSPGACITTTDIEGATQKAGEKLIPDEEVRHSGDIYRHVQVFLDNVRSHKKPEDDVEVGYYATNVGHLMNISYEVGRKIEWDGQRNQVVNDAEANALLTRQYRAPWKLEV